jgi:hypothetical protein
MARIHEGAKRDFMDPVRKETRLGEQIVDHVGHPPHQGDHFKEIPSVTRHRPSR